MKYIIYILIGISLSSCWTSKKDKFTISEVKNGVSISTETASFGAISVDMLSSILIDSIYLYDGLTEDMRDENQHTSSARPPKVRAKAYGLKGISASQKTKAEGAFNDISLKEFEFKSDSTRELSIKGSDDAKAKAFDNILIILGIIIVFLVCYAYKNK